MRLSSVRALKSEIAERTVPPIIEGPVAKIAARAAGPRANRERASAPAAIALGVAEGARAGDYRIAVRLQAETAGARRALAQLPAEIQRLARGEADIRVVRKIKKRAALPWYQTQVRPLTIGCSVGHYNITAGTIGAFVTDNRTGNICILSNNHVLADESRARRGDDILQQGALDGGVRPENRIGELERHSTLLKRGRNYIDAAIASVDDGLDYWPLLLRGKPHSELAGVASGIEPGDRVWKVGRTTGVTRGKVTAIEMDDVLIEFDTGDIRFDNQIEIQGSRGPFCDGGDSGSLIVDADGKACGLLFAGGEDDDGRDLTYANPIKTVLSEMDVKLAL